MWKRRNKSVDETQYGVAWLLDEDNPWPVPVLDVRGFTQTMVSMTTDRTAAANAISFGGPDDRSFAEMQPRSSRTIEGRLTFRVDRMLADGVLFLPRQMEHKWALFHDDERVLFVRSWGRELLVTAATTPGDGVVELTDVVGSFFDPEEPPELTVAIVDFLIRTHALKDEHPAPVPTDLGAKVDTVALYCFSAYGNLASFATPHRFDAPMSDRPLRSHSLFHIAIAQHDLSEAQRQLDAGVPVDLLAGDGLTALQWAAHRPGSEGFEWLVARGLDVDVRSEEGATVLMTLAQRDPANVDLEQMSWLVDHGADPNASDHRGFTALHRAAERGSDAAVGLLLERGADPGTVAQENYTARSLAASHGHESIVTMLDAAGSS